MAFQARQRDPLLDSSMQAAIERRGKELIGIALIGLGLTIAAMLGSYVPEDPSWLSATDEPVQNLLGRFGASIASPLFVIVGFGSWGLAALCMAWGLRFMFHTGEERAISRLIFAPIGIACASVYASTIVPSSGWTHSFGLGGLFGDTVLGALVSVLPITASFGVKLLAIPVGLATLAIALFVLGCTGTEMRRFVRFVVVGVIMGYDALMTLFGRGARNTAVAARTMAENRARRRSETVHHDPDDAVFDDDDHDDPQMAEPRAGLLASMSSIVRRAPEPDLQPELFDTELEDPHALIEAPSEDRIKARIADVIKARMRQAPARKISDPAALPGALRPEPPVRRYRGPAPLLVKSPTAVRSAPMAQIEDPEDQYHAPVSRRAEPHPQARVQTGRSVPPSPAAPVAMPAPDMDMDGYDARDADPEGYIPVAYDDFDSDYDASYGSAEGYGEGMAADSAAPQPVPGQATQPPSPAGQMSQSAPLTAPRVERGAVDAPRSVVQHPPRKTVAPSRRAQAEAQPDLQFEEPAEAYEVPPLALLTNPGSIERHHLSDEALEENARMLENVLDDYGVKGEIVSVRPGPVVTMYELEPAPGLKASRVIGLADDIARSMSALSARVSTVPGRSVIGIELPNSNREKVVLREILSSREFDDVNTRLPLALGKDIGGDPIVANLAKMPHLLIAGTTGSGKSVAINTMILSLLYRLSPEECRLIMIDPKMLELSVYDGIPHLLSPVVTDPKKAVVALKWVVGEMEERYRKMSKMGVRNIEGYNGRVRDAQAKGEMFSRTVQTGFDDETGEPVFETEQFAPELLPFIVVVVDEMADLMMVAGKEIEACIQRLAQMARASGIHLIMATQRPSVDVITGTIKANFPTRISFQVTSKIDSRTILGEMGAEQLLGMGDMLYMAGGSRITRVHGPFVSDEEVEEIVNHLKAYGPPDYIGGVVEGPSDDKSSDIDAVLGLNTGGNTDGEDALYDQAVAIVIKDRKCSTSYIQRKLAIGYNKAARLVEQMEDQGVVSASNHVGKREVLVPEQG